MALDQNGFPIMNYKGQAARHGPKPKQAMGQRIANGAQRPPQAAPQRLSPGVYRNANGSLGHSAQAPQAQTQRQPQMPYQGMGPGGAPGQMQGMPRYGGEQYWNQMPTPPQGQGWQQEQGGGWSNPQAFAQQQQMAQAFQGQGGYGSPIANYNSMQGRSNGNFSPESMQMQPNVWQKTQAPAQPPGLLGAMPPTGDPYKV